MQNVHAHPQPPIAVSLPTYVHMILCIVISHITFKSDFIMSVALEFLQFHRASQYHTYY